jgi:hypothetical protein
LGLIKGLFRLGFLKGEFTGGVESFGLRFTILHKLPESIRAD